MSMVWGAALIAIFTWWISTGAILFAVHWASKASLATRKGLTLALLPLAVFGFWLVNVTLGSVTVLGAYLAFFGALLMWGWIELSFLTGVLVGEKLDTASPNQSEGSRFFTAFRSIMHHEAALLIGLVALIVVSIGAENRIALASFLILYVARVMAKLNIYFGVPRINTEFLPDPLSHLKIYFCQGPITFAFPIAITLLTVVFAVCVERLWTAETDPNAAGFALLSTLTALALLEHWLMVVPLPDAKLWRWLLPDTAVLPEDKGKTHGF